MDFQSESAAVKPDTVGRLYANAAQLQRHQRNRVQRGSAAEAAHFPDAARSEYWANASLLLMLLLLLRCSLMLNSFSVVVSLFFIFKETLSSSESQQDTAANIPANPPPLLTPAKPKQTVLDDCR